MPAEMIKPDEAAEEAKEFLHEHERLRKPEGAEGTSEEAYGVKFTCVGNLYIYEIEVQRSFWPSPQETPPAMDIWCYRVQISATDGKVLGYWDIPNAPLPAQPW